MLVRSLLEKVNISLRSIAVNNGFPYESDSDFTLKFFLSFNHPRWVSYWQQFPEKKISSSVSAFKAEK